ncbi:hypothetical protein GCM10011591_26460 [Nocardia camponoti]|uniref:Uncharacterized protein n=1 Tax=Nocardia camponoti TaxID=1616106 RepID=A0A917V976_9NOCA|nr:hypothetical protein GCM10011591_26460 [Nocardia camponoti]
MPPKKRQGTRPDALRAAVQAGRDAADSWIVIGRLVSKYLDVVQCILGAPGCLWISSQSA